MVKLNPQIFSDLYHKDLIAYGTGNLAKRIIPYLVQDPNIRLQGVTNSRVTTEDEGTFLDTGLPIRSIHAWAERLPNAVVLLTALSDIEGIIATCKSAGFQNYKYFTWNMMSALLEIEAETAQAQQTKIFEQLCLANELHDAHKAAFSEFKGCNRQKTAALVGTGPTLNYYTYLPNVSHIGVNGSFLKSDLRLDYYFLTHYIPEWCEKLKEYNFVKFFNVGIKSRKTKDQIPEHVIEGNNGRRYFSLPMTPFTQIHTNIECYPLMGYDSIIFQAIHFALYTHPQKLLLVGCDCAETGHFDGSLYSSAVGQITIPNWIGGYENVKKFAAIHYPDTEIISVNPVGLKGMFRDVYTEHFLKEHPELASTECTLLSELNIGNSAN